MSRPSVTEWRNTVRSWDARYVGLAEALGATLLTTDQRLARADGPTCALEVVGYPGAPPEATTIRSHAGAAPCCLGWCTGLVR